MPLDEKLFRSQVSQSDVPLGTPVPYQYLFRVGIAANRQAGLGTPVGLGLDPSLEPEAPQPQLLDPYTNQGFLAPCVSKILRLLSVVNCLGMVGG